MRRSLVLGALAVLLALTGCEENGSAPTPAKEPAPAPQESAAPSGELPEAETKDAPADETPVEDTGEEKQAQATPPAPKPGAAAPRTEGTKPSADEPKEETVTEGDKKVEPQYAAWLQGGKYEVGKPGALTAVLVAKGEFHCNDKYPYKFKVGGAPDGVTFASAVATGASIGAQRTTLSIPFTPTSTGPKTISGVFYFSVCNESTCKIQKQNLSVTVDVDVARD